MNSRRMWIDPDNGWRWGFPKLYDPGKDGDLTTWLEKEGYPGRPSSIRQWYDGLDEADLRVYVQHLIDHLDTLGALEDGRYTFPNGDVWTSLSQDEKEYNERKSSKDHQGVD